MDIENKKSNFTENSRNQYIDFLRGIAAINIIVIHTAFYSGQTYTPQWFWNITLLLDVPFFFYLSGWASSYQAISIQKTIKSLFHIWLKWLFFISLWSLLFWISSCLIPRTQNLYGITDFLKNLFFITTTPGFPVIEGSMWFMPVYFFVLPISTLILMYLKKKTHVKEAMTSYLLLLVAFFVWFTPENSFHAITYLLFYCFFWFLGFQRLGKCKNTFCLILAIMLCIGGAFYASHIQNLYFFDLQMAKFPPTLKYGFASIPSILLAKYWENHIQKMNHFLLHIGKNAIFYYFGQGIGGSILYYVIDLVPLNQWLLKWIIALIINLIITIFTSEILIYLYAKLKKTFLI